MKIFSQFCPRLNHDFDIFFLFTTLCHKLLFEITEKCSHSRRGDDGLVENEATHSNNCNGRSILVFWPNRLFILGIVTAASIFECYFLARNYAVDSDKYSPSPYKRKLLFQYFSPFIGISLACNNNALGGNFWRFASADLFIY